MHPIGSDLLPMLELEVDERLHLCRDELVEDKDCEHNDKEHGGQRHPGKTDTVAPLEVGGKPVDDHSCHEEEEYIVVGLAHRPYIDRPGGTNGIDHRGGYAPGGLVGNGGIQIGTGAEKEAREGDEGESNQDAPRPT